MNAKLYIIPIFLFILLSSQFAGATAKSGYADLIISHTERIISTSEPDDVKQITGKIDSIKSTGDSEQRATITAKAVYATSIMLFQQRRYNENIRYISYCQPILRKIIPNGKETTAIYVNILNQYGMSYNMIGLEEQASKVLNEALKIAETNGLSAEKAVLYNNIAGTYMKHGDYARAEHDYSKAARINELLKDKSKLFVNYNNLSATAAKQRNYNRALEYAYLSIHQLDEKRDSDMMMLVQRNIAGIYLSNNEKSLATKNLREVITYQERHGQLQYLADSYRIMAEIIAGSDSAIAYLDKAVKIASTVGNKTDLPTLYAKLADYHEQRGNYAKANAYLRKLIAAKDTIASDERQIHAENLQDAFTEDRIQSEEMQELRIGSERAKHMAVAAVVLAAIAIAAMTVYFKSAEKKKHKAWSAKIHSLSESHSSQIAALNAEIAAINKSKEKSVAELDLNEKKRTVMSLQAVRYHEFMEVLNDDLKQLLLKLNPRDTTARKQIKEILLQIKRVENDDANREFIDSFGNINSRFYTLLTEKYPSLTQKELRMCALVKLGLSSKEIADITFREVRSVEAVRNRLRKKFALTPEEDLPRFLMKFD